MEYRARVQRGEGGGARAARVSMWARMAAITRGSVMTASMRNAAPQRGHWLMSLSNTRRRRYIQVISARVRADAGSPTRTRSPFRDPVHRPRTKPPLAPRPPNPGLTLPSAAHSYFPASSTPHGNSEVPASDPSNGLEPNTAILCRLPTSMGHFPYSRRRADPVQRHSAPAGHSPGVFTFTAPAGVDVIDADD